MTVFISQSGLHEQVWAGWGVIVNILLPTKTLAFCLDSAWGLEGHKSYELGSQGRGSLGNQHLAGGAVLAPCLS